MKEGGTGQTVCDGIGKPRPRITWAKAESDPNLPKNFKVVKNTTLVVSNAILSNAGTYFCMIANGPTSRNVEFEVIVQSKLITIYNMNLSVSGMKFIECCLV